MGARGVYLMILGALKVGITQLQKVLTCHQVFSLRVLVRGNDLSRGSVGEGVRHLAINPGLIRVLWARTLRAILLWNEFKSNMTL